MDRRLLAGQEHQRGIGAHSAYSRSTSGVSKIGSTLNVTIRASLSRGARASQRAATGARAGATREEETRDPRPPREVGERRRLRSTSSNGATSEKTDRGLGGAARTIPPSEAGDRLAERSSRPGRIPPRVRGQEPAAAPSALCPGAFEPSEPGLLGMLKGHHPAGLPMRALVDLAPDG
jgi:hypothetical protein